MKGDEVKKPDGQIASSTNGSTIEGEVKDRQKS
jgi:hypothetical protein